MISKLNRFHGRKSLDFVYRKGTTVRGELLSLRLTNSRREDYRLAVVVSRKVSKSAVVRNHIRRRIYETVRLYMKRTGQPLKKDIVVTVYDQRVEQLPTEKLDKTLSALLEKGIR
jgi:ribonuclease P protein component